MKLFKLLPLMVILTSCGTSLNPTFNLNVANADIQSMKAALDVYKDVTGSYPTTEQGISALVNKPTVAPVPLQWTETMSAIPKDPWGQPYQYAKSDKGITIISLGADKKSSSDDIVVKY